MTNDTSELNATPDEKVSIKPSKTKALLSYLQSALAAFAGIQSESKRQEDFAENNLSRIISVAFGSLVIFVVVVWIMVSIALPA